MSSKSCSITSIRCAALLVASLVFAAPISAQPDTAAPIPLLRADTTEASAWTPAPGSALRRSLLVPGWGQLYNRDYLKVPVVVGGVGAAATFVVVFHTRTRRYRRAAIFADCTNAPDTVPPGTCDGFESFEDEWIEAGSLSASSNRAFRDNSRRNRDLLVLLGLLAYGLQALDAYVSAELADFDVGEDLSLRVLPTPHGPAASLRWTF